MNTLTCIVRSFVPPLLGSLAISFIWFFSVCLSNAIAASTTVDINITANVVAKCDVPAGTSLEDVVFESYDPVYEAATTEVDTSSNMPFSCTKGVTTNLTMNQGLHATGSTRRMTDGTYFLVYDIYTSSDYSTVWNDSNAVTADFSTSGTPQTKVIYVRIPPGQDVPAGVYTDTVQATSSF